MKTTAPRVVSLVPSATETLLAWGVRPVAVTRFCEQPGYPTVGGTKDPDIAAIVALRPDLVVVCDQENRIEDAGALAAAGLRVHAVHITALAHVASEMGRLARELGLMVPDMPVEAEVPVEDVAVVATHVRVWIPIWKRPWMTINGDTYGSALLASIGLQNVAASHPDRYPTVTLEQAAAAAPDLVVAPSEPYPFSERHRSELEAVAPARFVDGRDLFWWGTRTAGARARLARVLA